MCSISHPLFRSVNGMTALQIAKKSAVAATEITKFIKNDLFDGQSAVPSDSISKCNKIFQRFEAALKDLNERAPSPNDPDYLQFIEHVQSLQNTSNQFKEYIEKLEKS